MLKDLVVEVHHRADRTSPGWSVGSGFLIGGALVLTASHNVGPGDLRVCDVTGIKRAATILVQGRDDIDLALLEIHGGGIDAPRCRYGAVDRTLARLVKQCWAVGFPRYKQRENGESRSAQVDGVIPTGDNLDHELLTLRVANTPRKWITDQPGESPWSGMSGAVVFAGDVVVGVISEHHHPEGDSSLGVVPLTAVDALTDDKSWWRLLGVRRSDLVRLPRPGRRRRPKGWEEQLGKLGLYVWTDADFLAGLSIAKDTAEVPPIEPGEPVDATLLKRGGLPNLQKDFAILAPVFDEWLATEQRKRGDDRLPVLWLVGDPGPHRSKGLLACLSRADMNGRAVYDAGGDLGLTRKVLERCISDTVLPVPPLISVDLDAQQSEDAWKEVRSVLVQARKYASKEHHPYPQVVVGGTAEQAQDAHNMLRTLMEITSIDTKGRPQQRPYSDSGMTGMESTTLSREHVFNRGLPITARRLFGREGNLTALRKSWSSERTRVLSIVAYGGTGKSALVNTWLREMRENDYLGARRVLAWSFYSQGTKENLVSADPFVSFALSWLGDDSSVSLSPWERGVKLASLIKQHNFLLVLDGMEPLQHPITAPDVGGALADDSIRALLEELAKPDWNGLCVITTRVPLTDLYQFESEGAWKTATVVRLELENLDDEAGSALLQHLVQEKYSFSALQQAVHEVEGHALAITLLGNYLRDVHHGDLAGRFDLEKLTIDVREGGHARRIMASYVRWLEQGKRFAELSLLQVIGLFDRPAAKPAMEALLADADINLFSALDRVGGDVWNGCVDALRKMGLLNNEIPDWPGTLDAHPLVREHFRDVLLKADGDMWGKGNRTLFRYYSEQAPDEPSDSDGMNTLYSAVTHGCAAGLHQSVFDNILLPRVWRDRRTSFSTRRLGMTGSDLVALSNYFQNRRWTELQELRSRPLSARARVLVLTNAGVRLRQLGRLIDARQCFGAVVREIERDSSGSEEFEDASYAAAQYCELLVIAGMLIGPAGELDTALVNGQRAVEYADRGNDPYFSMHARSSLAEVHLMLGDIERANVLFEEARAVERERNPRPPFLYSQSLFRYGYYLIETGRSERILDDDAKDPDWGTNGEDSSLLSKAIRLLILGAAHRSLIEGGNRAPAFLVQAQRVLDDSVIAFRTAGYADYVVRGLLERAHFYRARYQPEDFVRALEDLDKATFEANRGRMELLYADVLLQRLACYLEFWPTMTNAERSSIREKISRTLDEATDFVDRLRYLRRSGMLATLRGLASHHLG